MQAVLAPGILQKKVRAESLENGEYIARFSFPRPGIYLVSFESLSLNVSLNKWFPLTFRAKMANKADPVPVKSGGSSGKK